MDELVDVLYAVILEAARQEDFSKLLSEHWTCVIVNDDGSVRSSGSGIKVEAIYTLWKKKILSLKSQLFAPRTDNMDSFRVLFPFTSSDHIPTTRKVTMTVFGAVIALMVLHGLCVAPFDPCLVHLFFHGLNLRCLHQAIISEWHPEFGLLLKRWIEAGPSGDLAPFHAHLASYLGIEDISCLADRDEAAHGALGIEILVATLLGPVSFTQAELVSFDRGINLVCPNGFKLCHVVTRLRGGTEAWLSRVWASQFFDLDSLDTRVIIKSPFNHESSMQAFQRAVSDDTITPKSILTEFLRKSGIPCPTKFAGAVPTIDPIVDLSQIDSPVFRLRMLAWASTGAPMLDLRLHVEVDWVNDHDPEYHGNSITRAAMIRQGKISFHTCFRKACIPISHLVKLISAEYSSDGEPANWQDAVDDWLLGELVGAIGAHTII